MAWYVIGFLALTFPFWLQGEIVAPHRQHVELAIASPDHGSRLENRKFSDYTNAYIPELAAHFDAPRSGWLATWTNMNGLGRPLYHLAGFSPAYLPAMLLARIAGGAERYLTLLSVGTCFLAGLFLLLACRESGHSVWAGLLAAASVAASPLFMYWLTFPMFPAVWCWSAGVLWGLARMQRSGDPAAWGIVAFSVYSLAMTAYPQPVVFHAYLLAGFAGHLALRKATALGMASALRFVLSAASAAVVAAALALPVYADLAHTAAQSARLSPDPGFFTAVLPRVGSPAEALRLLASSTFPELFGNPAAADFPLPYDGLSLAPLVVFLAVASLLLCPGKTWGWWLAIGVLLSLAFFHPLYAFGVKYLGFNLSRSTTLGSLMIPLALVGAHATDALLRDGGARRTSAVLVSTSVVGALLLLAAAYGHANGLAVRGGVFAAIVAIGATFLAQASAPRPALLLLALVAFAGYSSFPMMLRQPPSQIARTSPLLERVRAEVAAGSRFAVAAPGIGAFPPNFNAVLGVASIHAYDSLSSRPYQSLIRSLGGDVRTYGRWNDAISPDYGSSQFWMSDVSLVLAHARIPHANLVYVGAVDGVHLHRVVDRMGCCVLVSPRPATREAVDSLDPRREAPKPLAKHRDEGDRVEIELDSPGDSLLVLSRAFHRDWHAWVWSPAGWTEARTLPVSGFFQGVLVPGGARTVELRFEPYARFAWMVHCFWIALVAALVWRSARIRGRGP